MVRLVVGHRRLGASTRRSRRVGVQLVEDLLDAILAGDRLVVDELQLGDALAAAAARRSGGAGTAWRGRAPCALSCARLLVAEHGVVDARQLQVGADLHARERDEADARVVDLAASSSASSLRIWSATRSGREPCDI